VLDIPDVKDKPIGGGLTAAPLRDAHVVAGDVDRIEREDGGVFGSVVAS
jgi:hypothetical protein